MSESGATSTGFDTPKRNTAILARALLWVAAVIGLIPGCVLPSPPLVKEEPTVGITLDPALLSPVTPLVTTERLPNEPARVFSLRDAVTTDRDQEIHYYWFVDFDSANATEIDPDDDDDTFKVHGCDFVLIGVAGQLFTIEALATHGELIFDDAKADPRATAGGEPIHRVTWVLQVDGGQGGCL